MIHTSNETHKIGGGFEIGFPSTYIAPYTITLIDVKPHPVSTEKPDYVAILDVTKDSEFTDDQICGEENILVDGVCMPIPKPSDFRDLQKGETISNPEVAIIIQSLGAGLIILFIVIYAIKKERKNISSLRKKHIHKIVGV